MDLQLNAYLNRRRIDSMQRLISALLITICSILIAPITSLADCQVTLQWDAVNDASVSGYRIYLRVEGESYDYDWPEWQGTSTQHVVPDLDEDTVYFFVVRAFDQSGNESVDSNEVQFAYNGASPSPSPESPSLVGSDGDNASSGGGCFINSMMMR